MSEQLTYKTAGVNIDAGEKTVEQIKPMIRSTFNENVLADIGGFGGLYDASFLKEYDHPVLVSSVDGVGTKLKVAFMTGSYEGVGVDLVNHSVNDIAVCGARPIYFLDYFATGKLEPSVATEVISGFAAGCRENNCALIGGETAEMPSMYADGEFDLAGTIVGVVERKQMVTGEHSAAGDVLIGLPSNGLHTNGYSLARAVLFPKYSPNDYVEEIGGRLGEVLLVPHRSYLTAIQETMGIEGVHAYSHVTGGGLVGNTSRVVRSPLRLKVDWSAWERPAIFNLIQREGNVPEEDMQRTFNLGVGLVIVVARSAVDEVTAKLQSIGEEPVIIGQVE
ncbi:MAG: phosphoribosylformylglycinamidine cyclo-ligase [Ignavibacteriae bacterium]|nr:phosphoribosylformylglycinamidine cyclo-ligase [Ignavibacteriota bacterium]MCB9215034.1 phosphoribosylformylglycinamidine cyclo-ligase [Ignavibacteria bacterium]